MVNIIKDIDLFDDIQNYDIILVGANTYHTMGNGFNRKIRVHYPSVYDADMETKYADKKKLGSIISVVCDNKIFVICYIAHGYNFRPDLNPDFLNYEALRSCIEKINIKYKGKKIASTVLGHSKFEGNGDRDKIIKIINDNSFDIKLTLYDYLQMRVPHEKAMKYNEIINNENYTKEEKREMILSIKKYNEENTKTFKTNVRSRTLSIKEELNEVIRKNKERLKREDLLRKKKGK